MKRFNMQRVQDDGRMGPKLLTWVPHNSAAMCGWDSSAHGYELLDTLEVGATILDEDGDTWERVE